MIWRVAGSWRGGARSSSTVRPFISRSSASTTSVSDSAVERGGRLVQDEDRRVADDRARDPDPLALAARERQPALADHRVVPVGHLRDELVGVRELRRLHDLGVGGGRPTVRDVVVHGAAEEHGVLQHEADLAAEPLDREVAQIDAVDQDLAAGGVVKARDHADDRGLAAAGRADDPHELARLDSGVNVLQHRRLGVVGEGHVLELDPALQRPRVARVGALRDDGVGVQDRLHALDAHRRLRDRAAHLGEVLHRLEELREVGEEDDQRPDRHHVGEHERGAAPEHDAGADRGDDRHHRRQHRLDLPRLERRRRRSRG